MRADNEYSIACQHDIPVPPVEAYRGKHAVKSEAFFNVVRGQQNARMPHGWFYRPLKVEVEITDGCNQECPHCGMSAKLVVAGTRLRRDILLSLPGQLHALGIPGISLTGGEPFTEFSTMLELLSECRGKVDVVKLTTNAYWAETPESAQHHLRLLAERGIAESQLFRPVLMLSIGEQKVPLKSVVNAIVASQSLFDSRTLAVCISSLTFRAQENRVSKLEQCYKEIVGKDFPWDSIFLTKRSYIAAGRALSDESLPRSAVPIRIMCKDRGCFRQTVGTIVVPTPLIKADGSVFACSVFGMPKELLLGNLKDMTINQLLMSANDNSYVRILANGNLPLLMKQAPDHMMDGVSVDNFHEACWRLIGMHEQNKAEVADSSC